MYTSLKAENVLGCLKLCHKKFNERQRNEIMNTFWQKDCTGHKHFMKQKVAVSDCKELKAETLRKAKTRTYRLRLGHEEHKSVCQRLFLNKLGLQTKS